MKGALTMKNKLMMLTICSTFLVNASAYAGDKVVTGVISDFGCGDGCYLTITDQQGVEHSGYCSAKICDAWNESGEMPSKYRGKKVKTTVGASMQVDGAGNEMGEIGDFLKIVFITD